jgi:nanoRNase/pAp phosphatase (c-di-AMP/oligoRNAs hydrolase)
VYEGVVMAYIGSMDYPDLVAEMADFLLRLNQSRWVICLGAFEDKLVLSVRTRNSEDDAGLFVQALVGGKGRAGGHGFTAGGQIRLIGEDPRQAARQLCQRALEILRITPDAVGQPLI